MSWRSFALACAAWAWASLADAETLRVSATRANLRTRPSREGGVITTLARGQELEVLERLPGWFRVRVSSTGTTGFISTSTVEAPAAAAPAPVSEPVSEPGPGSPEDAPAPFERPVRPSEKAPPPPAPEMPALLAPDEAAGGRFTLVVGGALSPLKLDFSGASTFRDFSEDGKTATDYSGQAGPGFDLGLEYRLNRRLGVALSASGATRKAKGAFVADLPNPFFFQRHRSASGTVDGLSYRETAGHLDLFASGGSGSLGVTVFGGLSVFQVRAELLGAPPYEHSYPYDTVAIREVPAISASGQAVGFNVGASLEYRLSPRFGSATWRREPCRGSSKERHVPGWGNCYKVPLDSVGH